MSAQSDSDEKRINLDNLSHYHDLLVQEYLTPLSNRAINFATNAEIDEALFNITSSGD